MLFRTVVLLTAKVNLLMKGVAPAVLPVIVIVVSCAWFDSANGTKRRKRPVTIVMDAKRIFIMLVL